MRMKNYYLPILLTMLMSMVEVKMIAQPKDQYDFEYKGVYYKVRSEADKTCIAVSPIPYHGAAGYWPYHYRGDVQIPENVIGCYYKREYKNGMYQQVEYKGRYDVVAVKIYYNDSIFSLHLDDNIKAVSCYASYGLTSVNIPLHCDTIDFSNCISLKSIYIPSNVKHIFENGFASTSLETITIPDNVKSMGRYAFNRCYSLKSAKVGNGVRIIEGETFQGCRAMEKLTLGENIDSIGHWITSGCNSLTELICKTVTPPKFNSNSFSGVTELKSKCILYVPKNSVQRYKEAGYDEFFFAINAIPETVGDCNSDGSITMSDANAVVNYFLATDKSKINGIYTDAADVNGDGQITMADANMIVNMFLGTGNQ